MTTTEKAASSSRKILKNSFWYGLETLLEAVVFFGTSVAVARYLGPEKLGYFSYINVFITVITNTSSSGLTAATRKYMSEFLALDRPGTARAVYTLAHRYQLIGAIVMSALGVAGILLFGDPRFRIMSSILVLSLIPGVMSRVPAEANLSFQDSFQNTKSAMGYLISYVAVISLTIHFQWDLVGIASATFVGRTVEVALRTFSLNKRLRLLPLDTLDRELIVRIRRFCAEAIGMQLVIFIVWDRSEMFFLRAFSSLQQIAFYSVSYGFVRNLLQIPRVFAGSSGASLMVESSRDPARVDSIVRNTCRFILLILLPINLGAAALSSQAVHLVYGQKYFGAIPVLMLVAIFSIPQVFGDMPGVLLRAADRQRQMLHVIIGIGAVNVALDLLFIPHLGAVGAAWGNGLAQMLGAVAFWFQAKRFHSFTFPLRAAIRLLAAASIMALAAFEIGRLIPGVPGMIVAIATAVPLYFLLVRLFGGLEASDRLRLGLIGDRLPPSVRGPYSAVIAFVTPQPTATSA